MTCLLLASNSEIPVPISVYNLSLETPAYLLAQILLVIGYILLPSFVFRGVVGGENTFREIFFFLY